MVAEADPERGRTAVVVGDQRRAAGTRPPPRSDRVPRPAEIPDPVQVGALENLAKQTGEKGWWAAYESVLPAKFSTYVDLETDARELLAYSPLVLHGLLQTEDYARLVIRATMPDPIHAKPRCSRTPCQISQAPPISATAASTNRAIDFATVMLAR